MEFDLEGVPVSSKAVITLEGRTNGVAFSPDGTKVATTASQNQAKIWDSTTGDELRVFSGHVSSLILLDFSPDGKRLATTSQDRTAKIWEVDSGRELLTLRGHTDAVYGVAFDPEGRYLATASKDGKAKVWNAGPGGGEELAVLSDCPCAVSQIAYSPSGNRLAAASGKIVTIWDFSLNRISLLRDTNYIRDVAFSPVNENRLVTAGDEPAIKLWDLMSNQIVLTFTGHLSPVKGVTFNPTGEWVATASDDHTAKIWELTSGQVLTTFIGHKDVVESVVFDPSGKRLATSSWDGTAILWELSSGQPITTFTGHTSWVRSVAFSPDGNKIATAGDNTARIWDVQTGEELLVLSDHTNSVYDVTFSPEGTRLATASSDLTTRLWEVESGENLLTLIGHTKTVRTLAFRPDRQFLATGSDDRTVQVYIMLWEKLIDLARTRVTRSLTDEECQKYLKQTPCPAPLISEEPTNPFLKKFIGEEQTTTNEPEEVNCRLRSIEGKNSVKLSFDNLSNNSVTVYWLDYQGREILYFDLAPGESKQQSTFTTHPWCIRDTVSGRALAAIVAAEDGQVVTIENEQE